MDFCKLFKLENKKTFLENTEKINLEGKEDKEIRKIILDNFQKLFSHLELYNEGNQYTLPVFKKIKRPDSLAFCESEKRLYIFEYKSKADEGLIEQVRKYRDALQKNDSNLYELILKWNRQVNKHRRLEDFKNNKAKIICISPEFDDYAIGVEEEWEEEVYLIKITKYKDKSGELFVLFQSRNFDTLNSSINSIHSDRRLERTWINKLKEWINREIEPLAAENSLIMKGARGGTGWDFSKINQKEPFLSIWFRSQYSTYYFKPKIFFVNPSESLVRKFQLSRKHDEKGQFYKGNYFYFIETETNDGFAKAKILLTEFIKEKS